MSSLPLKIRDPKCPVILYEIIPPAKDTDDESAIEYAKCASDLVFSTSVRVDAFNIPEIRAEKREGERTYQFFSKCEPREFGEQLLLFTHGDTEIIVNHSPVYDPLEFQEKWLEEMANKYHQRNIILVGGESREIKYPGPSVSKMLEFMAKKFPEKFFPGGIAIPTRRCTPEKGTDEPLRMLEKIQAGIEYFTTQILYEPEHIQKLLMDYHNLCEANEIKPKRIFFSFSPVTSKKDLEFLRWLGVVIPEDAEKRMLKADIGIGWRSIKVLSETLSEILMFHDKHELNVPIGINIEHLTHHNFELTKELIEQLGKFYYLYLKD